MLVFSRRSSFVILELLDGIFHPHSTSERKPSKRIVTTLISLGTSQVLYIISVSLLPRFRKLSSVCTAMIGRTSRLIGVIDMRKCHVTAQLN